MHLLFDACTEPILVHHIFLACSMLQFRPAKPAIQTSPVPDVHMTLSNSPGQGPKAVMLLFEQLLI